MKYLSVILLFLSVFLPLNARSVDSMVVYSPAMPLDCGNEDFFHDVNERLHEEMEYRRIKHDYTSRPGIQDFNYWNLSSPHHLQFFDEYFNGKDTYEMKIRYTND